MRICVVDKHDIVRQNIEHFLTDRDHEVVALTSLEEVLERLANQEGPVDLVIADFPAEDPQCLALLRRVHEQQPQVPCVAMTNAGRIAPAEEAVACGVQAYIHKPVRLAELDFVLRRIGERGSSTVAPDNGSRSDVRAD